MESFISSNPGLRSRFTTTIQFPDFSILELSEILDHLARREKYILPVQVLAETQNYLEMTRGESASYGNARAVQDLFDQMKTRLANRMMSKIQSTKPDEMDQDEFRTFSIQDIPPYDPISIPAAFIKGREPVNGLTGSHLDDHFKVK
jgi:hypothetical protein